jgi:glycosyltransferase involved in cell wall biosynthesis
VIAQSPRPREVIVLDDDSSDDSFRVIEEYAQAHPFIRVGRNETHLGVTATYNRGFAMATGKYVLPGAADEREFARHPSAGVCVAYGSCTEGDGGPLILNDPGWCSRPTYLTPDDLCRKLHHTLPVSAIVVNREALLAAGGYRPELAWYSDWFAFLVVAFRMGVIHIPETLGIHVVHQDSYGHCDRDSDANVRVLGALLELLLSREYADVAPFFRRNGAACHFGPDLIRAASMRADRMYPRVLGYLTGFAPEVYEQLANDANPAIAELAAFFLQEPWRELIARRLDLEAENLRLIEEIQLTRLHAAPPGALGKLRWAAGLLSQRLRKAVGLHPMGRYRC